MSWTFRSSPAPRLGRTPFRPSLETLEDRTVPRALGTTPFNPPTFATVAPALLRPAAPAIQISPAALTQAPAVARPRISAAVATTTAPRPLVTLTLKPLRVDLLGLQIRSTPITVRIAAQAGSGQLLGNLLTTANGLVNLGGVNNALNTVLGNAVDLLNSARLSVRGVTTNAGPLSNARVTGLRVLDVAVAPVRLNLLGAIVETSPIRLVVAARSGPTAVLGNALVSLANLFNPPLPRRLDVNVINARLQNLISQLNQAAPNVGSSAVVAPVAIRNTREVLRLVVPPINLNLLGLGLQTSTIRVNADAMTGNGLLLGNVLTTLLNTLNATPAQLSRLNTNLNAVLAKVIGILNASSLTLPSNAVSRLSPVLQKLTLPDFVSPRGGATPILNLIIASPTGRTPPVRVDLLGLRITTSNIQARLTARTGQGQILGNLLFNVAHLLDTNASLSVLSVLNALGR